MKNIQGLEILDISYVVSWFVLHLSIILHSFLWVFENSSSYHRDLLLPQGEVYANMDIFVKLVIFLAHVRVKQLRPVA